MNKPAHHRQNLTHQAARENKVNRNLSPSFAKIQAQLSQTPPEDMLHTDIESLAMESTQHANKPRQSAPSHTRIHHTATDHSGPEEGTEPATPLTSLPQSNSPDTNSIRIAPWVIASITLTLALFSGNYAWHTQQDLEKLNARLEQLETQLMAPPVTDLLDSNDTTAKTEQELLSLSEAQEQLTSTVSTLQNALETDAKQATARLTALEDTLADLNLQVQDSVLSKKEDNAQMAQAKTAISKIANDSKTISAIDNSVTANWFITIASFSDPNAASSIQKKVQKIADTASITPITVNGKTLYRIRAEGYNSREGAEHEALTLQTQLGLSGLWVSRD